MASEYAQRLGMRLRATRTAQGLSLDGVEQKSRGQWKAVVVGSYERADRGLSVENLAGLAGFYGVAIASLLPEAGEAAEDRAEIGRLTRLVADAGINSLPAAQRVALAVLDDRYARQDVSTS
jgi:transcriptional regulator with XRE-family HTH domain